MQGNRSIVEYYSFILYDDTSNSLGIFGHNANSTDLWVTNSEYNQNGTATHGQIYRM